MSIFRFPILRLAVEKKTSEAKTDTFNCAPLCKTCAEIKDWLSAAVATTNDEEDEAIANAAFECNHSEDERAFQGKHSFLLILVTSDKSSLLCRSFHWS